MPDPYETLVRWYLRFNGYLSVENFIVHEAIPGGNRQGGETDIIAVRFPYSHEYVGFPIENDEKLTDKEAKEGNLTDIIIAEVKDSTSRANLNKVWTRRDDHNIDRVAYLVRWMGVFQDEESIHNIATELKEKYRSRRAGYIFRLFYFGCKKWDSNEKLQIPQITFEEIVSFFVHVRIPCYCIQGLGARSPHSQWDPLIKKIWSMGDREKPGSEEDKIREILDFLDTQKRANNVPT